MAVDNGSEAPASSRARLRSRCRALGVACRCIEARPWTNPFRVGVKPVCHAPRFDPSLVDKVVCGRHHTALVTGWGGLYTWGACSFGKVRWRFDVRGLVAIEGVAS